MYLDELQKSLQDNWNLQVHPSTVWKALRKAGYVMKKVLIYFLSSQYILTNHFFCSSRRRQSSNAKKGVLDTCTRCYSTTWQINLCLWTRVRVIVGQCTVIALGPSEESGRFVKRFLFEGRGAHVYRYSHISLTLSGKYSMLPALSLDGIIWLNIVEGSFDSDLFFEFINGLLDQMNPFPQKNSVIVMDNCRIHKRDDILQLILDRYILFTIISTLFIVTAATGACTTYSFCLTRLTITLSKRLSQQ